MHITIFYSLPTTLLPVEGSWTAWGAFGTCSVTCGTGSQSQTRGYSGNQPCSGTATNSQSCNGKLSLIKYTMWEHWRFIYSLFQLSVEGSWTAWSTWQACSSPCGTGTQTQTRSYTGTKPCSGSDTNTQSCSGRPYSKRASPKPI